MEKININKREILSEQTYRLERISFTKPGLEKPGQQLEYEVYFRPDAVTVLLVDHQNEEFILASQIRLPVYLNPQGKARGYLLEACAGLMEEGESAEQAAIREVREEMGYQISAPVKIGGVYTSAGGLTEYVHLFIAEVSPEEQKGEGGGAEDEEEDIEIIRLKFVQAKEMLENAEINDAKTVLLLQHFFLYH
jgi:GDP-mannose pyrophosphatase NudK